MIGKHQIFGHLHEILVTQKIEIELSFNFLLNVFNVWFQTRFFFIKKFEINFLHWNFAMFGAAKKWHWFFNLLLGKHPG
jgi:hypothetical protein